MRFVDSTIALGITQAFGLAVGFVVSVLVSRTYGAEGKGAFSLVLTLATILFGFSNLGLGVASQYFVSRRPDSIRGHFANMLVFPLAAAGLILCLFWLSNPIWRQYLAGLNAATVLAVAMMLPVMLTFESGCQLLMVTNRIQVRSAAVLLQSAIALIAAVALVISGVSAVGVSYAYVAGWLGGSTLALGAVVHASGKPRAPSIALLGETLKYSLWIYLGNLIRELFLRVDFLFLYSVRTSAEAGIYSVAASLTSGMTVIMTSIQTVFYPRTAAQSDEEARASTPQVYRHMAFVMFGAAVIMAIASRPLLSVFGRGFQSGMIPMLLLLFAMSVKGLNAILMFHILGRGNATVMTIVTSSTLVVSVLFNAILVPRGGMIGAAVATLLAFGAENVLLTILYRKLTHGPIAELYAFKLGDVLLLISETKAAVRRLAVAIKPTGYRSER